MKRSSLLFRTCIGWLWFGVLFLQSSYAQDSNSTNSIAMHAVLSDGYFKPQSPDVWSMIKYGDANIDYYSGRLGLNIPIYTYDDPAFKIPISIDYASNGFQPGASIGVVGMGWYLNVGGAITREVRGIRDDAIKETFDWRWGANENETLKWDQIVYPDGVLGSWVYARSVRIDGYAQNYFNSVPQDSLNFVYTGAAGQEYMPYWVNYNNDRQGIETEPDIFHFKFMDYSGSFILQPNRQIKVFNTNTPAGEFEIKFDMDNSQPSLSKFVIITGNKTKYYFEYPITCQTQSDISSSLDTGFNFTWKLTRIEAPNGETVRFVYNKQQADYTTITPVINIDKIVLSNISGNELPPEHQIQDPQNMPSSKFTVSNSVHEHLLDSIIIENRANIVFTYNFNSLLASVQVYNNTDESPVKTCTCEYVKTTGNRLVHFLKKVNLSDVGQYAMDYYDETAQYEHDHTFKVDQYGYFNNNDTYAKKTPSADLQNIAEDLRTLRPSSETHTRMGMLKALHYPTGGYSNFIYEQNTAFHQGKNTNVGGLRIKQIDTYSKEGKQTQNRKFSYCQKDDSNKSSGKILQYPGYYFKYTAASQGVYLVDKEGKQYSSGVIIDREIVSSLNNIGFSQNSYIEYLRVVEEIRKLTNDIKPISITEYNFHSADGVLSDGGLPTEAYEAISNNRLYSFDNWRLEMELAPSSEINEYMRVTSTFTGGKLRSKTEYAEDLDHPVKHESYSYGYYQSEDPINVYTAYLCQAVNHLYRTNAIYQNQKITELYNKDSVLIYNNETKYLVNDLGRTSAVVQTDSKGDEIREMYSYLDRVPAYPTEIIKTNKGNVISAMKIDYEQQSNAEDHYTPLKVWKGAVGVAPLNIEYRPDCIYSHYDTHGNPRQVVDKNGKTTCYFWGYNGRHIVAKVENSTYNILLGYGIGTTYSEALPADVEAQLRNDEEENFIVTTYTYKPLVGITSITDPSGHSVYYEYNDSGKLKVIRDDKGKVLKSYDYHIVTDNQ